MRSTGLSKRLLIRVIYMQSLFCLKKENGISLFIKLLNLILMWHQPIERHRGDQI